MGILTGRVMDKNIPSQVPQLIPKLGQKITRAQEFEASLDNKASPCVKLKRGKE
jgi:hypothetical protein